MNTDYIDVTDNVYRIIIKDWHTSQFNVTTFLIQILIHDNKIGATWWVCEREAAGSVDETQFCGNAKRWLNDRANVEKV